MELWGGIECTINRVGNQYFDQLDYAGHYNRVVDCNLLSSVGIKAIRYPVLWEKHQPLLNTPIDWDFTRDAIENFNKNKVTPVLGLVHHGSGPEYCNFFDGSFENGLASYARQVALQFPDNIYYTPINEPVTTARFCGLYGFWFPHAKDDYSFLKILLSQCKATVLAMKEIRKINPLAQLIQTEDLGKTYSTPELTYQAKFENKRRWLGFDLLCRKVTPQHDLWSYCINNGIDENELYFFLSNPCVPNILGLNYYVTSERFIDENLENYPPHTHGGNGKHFYADVEAVRVDFDEALGFKELVKEAWNRYQTPVAITEVHLHCSREEQMRWFYEIWNCSQELCNEGIPLLAVTAWAMFGSFGWNKMLTSPPGDYEPGVFDVRSQIPRPMALAKLLSSLARGENIEHPLLEIKGWWRRNIRFQYNRNIMKNYNDNMCQKPKPLLILGQTGTLGKAFEKICQLRGITTYTLNRSQLDICDIKQIKEQIELYKPWAIVNTAGYVKVDEAEIELKNCYNANTYGAMQLAECCDDANVKLLTFSSDLVFDGKKQEAYNENDITTPTNVYGSSKALAELHVLSACPQALVIRTSAFFGPWDKHNFVYHTIKNLLHEVPFAAAYDVTISPTYVPDLVHTALDLLMDGEKGIWHITNSGNTTWAEFAKTVANMSSLDSKLILEKPNSYFNYKAVRPINSALVSVKGITLPHWQHALQRYFSEQSVHPEMHILM